MPLCLLSHYLVGRRRELRCVELPDAPSVRLLENLRVRDGIVGLAAGNRLVIGGGDFGIFFFLRLTSVYYMIYL